MVYRRGHQIVLENEKTGEHVAVKVVMHDSIEMVGWLRMVKVIGSGIE